MKKLGILLFASFFLTAGFQGEACADGSVMLQFRYPEGKTAIYKNSWTFEYYSKRADLIDRDKDSGAVDVRMYGQWKSEEQTTPVPAAEGEAGGIRVLATIRNAESTVMEDRVQISLTNFPYLLGMLNDKQFSWKIAPSGEVQAFQPEFKIYEIYREGVISEMHQLWMPEVRPVLPEKAVKEGDTWTGEQRIDVPITQIRQKGYVVLNSTYKLKKLKEKKGVRTAQIEEIRKVQYRGWIFSNAVSILVEAEGEGKGEWILDAGEGMVIEHEAEMEFGKVSVTLQEENELVDGTEAKMKLKFKRVLDKIK